MCSSSVQACTTKPPVLEKYVACMLLAAVGDAVGFKNGSWEFTFEGERIHAELKKMGGIEKLNINGWFVRYNILDHHITSSPV